MTDETIHKATIPFITESEIEVEVGDRVWYKNAYQKEVSGYIEKIYMENSNVRFAISRENKVPIHKNALDCKVVNDV